MQRADTRQARYGCCHTTPTVLVVSAIIGCIRLISGGLVGCLPVSLASLTVAKGGATSVAPRSISRDSHSLLSLFLFLSQRRQQSR
jgi:hypothetical protein